MNDVTPKKARRARWRFGFRLRSLFMLTAMFALPLGYVTFERHRCFQQHMALHSPRESIVDYGPGYVPGYFDAQEVDTKRQVRSGAMQALLGDNSGDQVVGFDFGMEYRTVSNRRMYALSHLHNLNRLEMPNCTVESPGFRHLAGLYQLETLLLTNSTIKDNDLYFIRHLERLTKLALNRTKIGDDGVAHLANLTNLKTLHLQQTQIGDAGVRHLSKLTNLEHLDLSDTLVSEKSIDLLAQITTLKLLALNPETFSFDARDKLRKRLPQCDIIFAKN